MRFSTPLLVLILLLAGCAGGPELRRGQGIVTIENQRSHERATIQYRKGDGELDLSGWQQASYLMRDTRTPDGPMIDPTLLDFMADIVASLGKPPQTVILVTSGYRSPRTNADLRRQSGQVAENSYHLHGQAADIRIAGVRGRKVAEVALRLQAGGAAYYASSDHVHIDTGPVRTWSAH